MMKGLLTYLPGVASWLRRAGTGGTVSASYCYEVWLKHLTMLSANGLGALPGTIAELGPGDSLGTGLAAMLSGADRYYALDVEEYSDVERNLEVLGELVDLFRARAPRPPTGWPGYDRYLGPDLFPGHVLTDRLLEGALDEKRVELIREAVSRPGESHGGICVKYMVPWSAEDVIEQGSVDVVFSQSVMEHVEDLEATYAALHRWLRPGGIMSHQIDFAAHGYSRAWNGTRAYSPLAWKIIQGRRLCRLNMAPFSEHIAHIEKLGFEVLCALQRKREDGIGRARLAPRWAGLSDDDLVTSDAFIQARKR